MKEKVYFQARILSVTSFTRTNGEVFVFVPFETMFIRYLLFMQCVVSLMRILFYTRALKV
jgi:hypothetical protein